jgi:hypothetical protein
MKAGGWKELERVIPSYKSDDQWWYWSWPKVQTYSWTSAQHFADFTVISGRTTGIYYVKDMVNGDLLQYRLKSSSNMNHSMVVTGKYGNYPTFSYHTPNTRNKRFYDFYNSSTMILTTHRT